MLVAATRKAREIDQTKSLMFLVRTASNLAYTYYRKHRKQNTTVNPAQNRSSSSLMTLLYCMSLYILLRAAF
jgi:DNA-directed RNA polymerase specialized sigma24 family protein